VRRRPPERLHAGQNPGGLATQVVENMGMRPVAGNHEGATVTVARPTWNVEQRHRTSKEERRDRHRSRRLGVAGEFIRLPYGAMGGWAGVDGTSKETGR